MKKTNLLLLASSLLLAGCSGDASSTGTSDSPLPSDSSSVEEDDGFSEVEWNPNDAVSMGSVGGAMIDASIGFVFTVGESYVGTIGFGSVSTSGARVSVSDNGVCEASISETGGTITFKGLKPGESILSVYDADGFLYFRDKLTFRKALQDEGELMDFLLNDVDHYESRVYPGIDLYFLSESTGLISGSDMGTPIQPAINFGFEYREFVNGEFYLSITEWENYSPATFTIVGIYISASGFACHPMTSSASLDYFTPVLAQ